MARRVLVLLLFLGAALPVDAWAWTEEIYWQPTPGATAYRVERSTDGGATWALVSPPTLAVPLLVYTGAESGLTLFRVGACKAGMCFMRPAAGPWHHEGLSALGWPSGVGQK